MTRLIDADALHMILVKMKDFGELTAKKAIRAVENAPTIDAEPVRHGKWIYGSTLGHSWMKCSECCVSQNGQTLCFSYCPNCGARMDKDDR